MKLTLFCENVTVIDLAYLDTHKGVMGMSYNVDVEFYGNPDEEGILYDFSYAKKKVKSIIDDECDHRLVLPEGLVEKNGEQGRLEYVYGPKEQRIEYFAPLQAYCEIPFRTYSIENLKVYLESLLNKKMPENINSVQITLREEELSSHSSFQYTHGLKDHYGNCQRLFHGHRNKIEVFLNDQKSLKEEEWLASSVFRKNIHFAFWDNLENADKVKSALGRDYSGRLDKLQEVRIGYQGNQGEFQGTLPGDEVYLMPIESTVENIAYHFAGLIKKKYPQERVKVKAFEGIGKGSFAEL